MECNSKNSVSSEKTFLTFVDGFYLNSKVNILLILFVIILTYGIKFTYISYNNDQCYSIFSNLSGAIMQGRWISILPCRLWLTDRHIVIWSDTIGAVLLVLAATLYTYFWWIESNYNLSNISIISFILFFIVFPLNLEILVYPCNMIYMGLFHILIACSLLLIQRMMSKGFSYSNFLLCCICASCAISGYECFSLVFLVSILLVFFYDLLKEKQVSYLSLVKKIKIPVLCFICSHLIYVIVTILVLWMCSGFTGINYQNTGADRRILWFSEEVKNISLFSQLFSFICNFSYKYIYSSLFSFGLFVFWLTVLVAIFIVFQHSTINRYKSLIVLFFSIIAIFALSLLLGKPQYYRTCQAMPVFVGSIWLIYLEKIIKFRRIIICIVALLILFQTKECSLYFAYDKKIAHLDEMRYYSIGNDIKSQSFYNGQKVIFTGELGNSWDPRYTMARPFFLNLPRNNSQIYTQAGLSHLDSRCEQFTILMNYLNKIILETLDNSQYDYWKSVVIENNQPAWPKDGYIKQYGEQIVVNLGFPPEPLDGKEQFINGWKKIFSGNRSKNSF